MISPELPGVNSATTIIDQRGQKSSKAWLIIAAVLAALALGFWIALTPPGFWAKIRMIGYAVCHQIPSHSFFEGEHQFPLCARCTGMYLGSLLGLGFTWLQGKRGGFPPVWVWLIFTAFFLGFAFDGINSAIGLLPGFKQVYPSQNWFRMATGLGMGLTMGSLLAVAFTQAVWQDALELKIFARFRDFLMMLLAALAVGALVLWGSSFVKQALMLISTLGVVIMLTLIYSVPASILFFGQSKANDARSLWLPLLLGFFIMILQLGGMAYLRYLLTSTLLPINL